VKSVRLDDADIQTTKEKSMHC